MKEHSIFTYKRLLLFVASLPLLLGYYIFLHPNVETKHSHTYLCISTNSSYRDVSDQLIHSGLLTSYTRFNWVAQLINYPAHVKAGRYKLTQHMSTFQLVRLLYSGKQTPVTLTFNTIRTKEELAGRLAHELEADSLSIISRLNDNTFLKSLNKNSATSLLLFIPNTYEFFWNTSADALFSRMNKEYHTFWNSQRLEKAKQLKLTPDEIGILASIVQQETTKKSEMSTVAGVYINRLRKGMPLQADPTLVFAHQNFELKRVLNKHKQINSPYNTYKFKGLPPGPICLPESYTIDYVLQAKKHKHLYFCAKPDLSGYHSFSPTFSEHLINAKKYQAKLNKLQIGK